MNKSRLMILLCLTLTLGVYVGCSMPFFSECETFASHNDEFEDCVWKTSEALSLCKDLGFEGGMIRDSALCSDSSYYITVMTCCE